GQSGCGNSVVPARTLDDLEVEAHLGGVLARRARVDLLQQHLDLGVTDVDEVLKRHPAPPWRTYVIVPPPPAAHPDRNRIPTIGVTEGSMANARAEAVLVIFPSCIRCRTLLWCRAGSRSAGDGSVRRSVRGPSMGGVGAD